MCAPFFSLQVGVPNEIVDAIFLDGLVECVYHVLDNVLFLDFLKVFLDLLAQRGAFLLLSPLLLDLLLVIRMSSLLILSQRLDGFSVEILLTHVFNKLCGVANKRAR